MKMFSKIFKMMIMNINNNNNNYCDRINYKNNCNINNNNNINNTYKISQHTHMIMRRIIMITTRIITE